VSDYKEDFQDENGVLYVHLSGKFPNELLHRNENLFRPLIDACSARNCTRALVDARDLEADFGTMALFQAGEDAAFLRSIGIRVALLAREEMLDPFFDAVVANRGGDVSVFTDMEAARRWVES
jgi:hypothetical protein